jgi:hypothetical protein
LPTINGKGPKHWSTLTQDELLEMSLQHGYRNYDIALRCDGLAVADFDTDDPWIKETFWGVLIDHGYMTSILFGRRGSKGGAFLFRDPGGVVESFQLRRGPDDIPDGEGEVFFELLAGPKRMITWPPSRHRKTSLPYVEIGSSLWSIESAEELPVCTPELVDDLRSALAPWTRPDPIRPAPSAAPVVRGNDLNEAQRRRLEKYARTILARRAHELATSTGQRRIKCFQIGCRIGVYVHHGIIPLDDVEYALEPAWRACGGAEMHGAKEFKTHLRNGIAFAANDPLCLPEDRPFSRTRGRS